MAEPGARRLFFALWPDQSARSRLVELARRIADRGCMPHPEDIHITLVFLGEVSAQRLDCAIAAGDALRSAPFELRIDRVGFWPRPRILWCGPTEMPPGLLALVRDLQQGLRACGFEPERRPYQAHATLARKARNPGNSVAVESFRWPVSELVLASSETVEAPPRYRILRQWPLTG